MKPVRAPSHLQIQWSQPLPDALQGIAIARETGAVLVWDQNRWIYLYDRRGERSAQIQLSDEIVHACAADDGSVFCAVDSQGQVHWLAGDLSTKRRHRFAVKPTTAVLDPYGRYLAIAEQTASILVVNCRGVEVSQLQPPKACRHLAVASSRDYFVACADYGFVSAFDLSGKWLWRDGLVVHIGDAALAGNGGPLVLACFSEGVQTYDEAGKKQKRWMLPQPIKTAAMSFDGRIIFAGGAQQQIYQLDQTGEMQHYYQLKQPISQLACGPLGDYLVYSTADKTLTKASIGSTP